MSQQKEPLQISMLHFTSVWPCDTACDMEGVSVRDDDDVPLEEAEDGDYWRPEDDDPPAPGDRQAAVHWLEMQIVEREIGHIRRRIEVPLDLAKTLLNCARDGMMKGGGRQPPRLSRWKQIRIERALRFGRDRREQLTAKGMPYRDALEQAAEEARGFLHEYGGWSGQWTTCNGSWKTPETSRDQTSFTD